MKQKRQGWAEQMISLIYKNGEKPAVEFMQDLFLFINGSLTHEEMRARIISRHQTRGE